MGFWLYAPPGVESRLAELAELFAASRAFFFDIAQDEHHWAPSPGSLAAEDLVNGEAGPGGPWSEEPVRLMIDVLSNYLLTAAHHLGGLAILHKGQEVLLSPPLLTRAILENCARVFWVLDGRPLFAPQDTTQVDHLALTRVRVARAYLEEFLSAQEAKTVAGRLGEKSGDTYKAAQAAYGDLRDKTLPRLFANVTRESLGTNCLDGQLRLTPEECVVLMYEKTNASPGVALSEREGKGVYGFLCNMTHPTLYPIREMTTWHKTDDGHFESHLTLDVDFLGRLASAGVMTFFNTVSLLMSFMGWTSDKHGEWARLIDRTLPGAFI